MRIHKGAVGDRSLYVVPKGDSTKIIIINDMITVLSYLADGEDRDLLLVSTVSQTDGEGRWPAAVLPQTAAELNGMLTAAICLHHSTVHTQEHSRHTAFSKCEQLNQL